MKLNRTLVFRLLCISLVIVFVARDAEAFSNRTQIQDIMSELTPEQKVGQLFLVGFEDADIARETSIYKLIADYRIGGVMLMAENDNFGDDEVKTKLKEAGIAPPSGEINCPQCDSKKVQVVSEFGSTACKALYKCLDCLEPFHHFKQI